MKLTTRSELISQGYEIQQKLMPLIEQVRIILLCSYLHVIGHCVHLCTGADDNQHSWFWHSPWCRIIYKVRAQSHSMTHSCDFTVCIYIVRLFHPTTVLCLKSDISGSEWCCHVNGTSIYVVLFVFQPSSATGWTCVQQSFEGVWIDMEAESVPCKSLIRNSISNVSWYIVYC